MTIKFWKAFALFIVWLAGCVYISVNVDEHIQGLMALLVWGAAMTVIAFACMGDEERDDDSY